MGRMAKRLEVDAFEREHVRWLHFKQMSHFSFEGFAVCMFIFDAYQRAKRHPN